MNNHNLTTPPTMYLTVEDDGNNNTLIYAALGGVCASCIICGFLAGAVVSKKKTGSESREEIAVQTTTEGKCISLDTIETQHKTPLFSLKGDYSIYL